MGVNLPSVQPNRFPILTFTEFLLDVENPKSSSDYVECIHGCLREVRYVIYTHVSTWVLERSNMRDLSVDVSD